MRSDVRRKYSSDAVNGVIFRIPPETCESGLIIQSHGSVGNVLYVKVGARDGDQISSTDCDFVISPRQSADPQLKPDVFTNLPVGNVLVLSSGTFAWSFVAWASFKDYL